MVAMYNIAGRQVGSHWLAIATLSTAFATGFWATSGGEKKETKPAPPINASSAEEEKFIKDFMEQANKEESKAKH